MTNIKFLVIVTALSMLIVSCAPATPAAEPTIIPTVPQTEADVPRVSVEDAAAAIKSGEAIILDVRSAQAYQASHIPGAISLPLFDIESNPTALNLNKDKWIITYCT